MSLPRKNVTPVKTGAGVQGCGGSNDPAPASMPGGAGFRVTPGMTPSGRWIGPFQEIRSPPPRRVLQITFPGGPCHPAQLLSAAGGQECGLPARKRPRWPLSQAARGASGPRRGAAGPAPGGSRHNMHHTSEEGLIYQSAEALTGHKRVGKSLVWEHFSAGAFQHFISKHNTDNL